MGKRQEKVENTKSILKELRAIGVSDILSVLPGGRALADVKIELSRIRVRPPQQSLF